MTTTDTLDSIALRVTYPVAIGEPWPHHDLLAELVWTLPGRQTVETHTDGDVGFETAYALTIYCEPDQANTAQTRLLELLNEFAMAGAVLAEPRPIHRNDWANAWKAHWKPTPIAGGWVICPTWEAYTPTNNERVITLDPGAAFGTGTHPTTQLMLTALSKLSNSSETKPFDEQRILDVGCGSGILSIGAAQLGCRDLVGIDVEPAAMAATEANATLNNAHHCITTSTTPLEELCLTPFDGVVMNIHWPILEGLIPEVAKRLVPGGWLLVSGLIEKTVPLCEEALEASGFVITATTHHDGWFVLEAMR